MEKNCIDGRCYTACLTWSSHLDSKTPVVMMVEVQLSTHHAWELYTIEISFHFINSHTLTSAERVVSMTKNVFIKRTEIMRNTFHNRHTVDLILVIQASAVLI